MCQRRWLPPNPKDRTSFPLGWKLLGRIYIVPSCITCPVTHALVEGKKHCSKTSTMYVHGIKNFKKYGNINVQYGLNKLAFRQSFWVLIIGKEKNANLHLQIQKGFYYLIFPSLGMRKQRSREAKSHAQGHTDDTWSISASGLNPSLSEVGHLEFVLFPCLIRPWCWDIIVP